MQVFENENPPRNACGFTGRAWQIKRKEQSQNMRAQNYFANPLHQLRFEISLLLCTPLRLNPF